MSFRSWLPNSQSGSGMYNHPLPRFREDSLMSGVLSGVSRGGAGGHMPPGATLEGRKKGKEKQKRKKRERERKERKENGVLKLAPLE